MLTPPKLLPFTCFIFCACGYILKGIGGDELVEIIKSAFDGGSYVSPALAAQLLVERKDEKAAKAKEDGFSDLTAREEQILKEVAQGLSNKEIARRLNLSAQEGRNGKRQSQREGINNYFINIDY